MEKLTKEEALINFKKAHGDKYNYTKVEYINATTKIIIICPIHGEFKQKPHNHTEGKGCSKCGHLKTAAAKLRTNESFINNSKIVHNNKYNYSKSNYVRGCEKVIITCPEHGDFSQTPDAHLCGKGCAKCSGVYRPSFNEFLEIAKKTHGNKYEYSNVNNFNLSAKINIICPIHGKFKQSPKDHLKGHGCSECSKIISGSKKRHKLEDVIAKLKIKNFYNDSYTYEEILFLNNSSHMLITNTETNTQHIMPIWNMLARKNKCCCQNAINKTQYLIESSKIIHDNKYDYSKSIYTSPKEKVIIICPEHGDFKLTFNTHLCGQGCSRCSDSKGEREIRVFLKKHEIDFTQQKRFIGCKKKRELPFDFFLPTKKICIEFNGKQHYESIPYWGGDKTFKSVQHNDKIKIEYCKKEKIKLIIIKYTENVQERLKNELIQNKKGQS